MKVLPAVLGVLLLALPLPARGYDRQDTQHLGMGVSGIALSGSYASMFANPANLTQSPSNVFLGALARDTGYVDEPLGDLLVSFCGKRLSFTVEQETSFTRRDESLYNALKVTYLEMDFAMAWKVFSFGASLRAQTAMKRTSIEFHEHVEALDWMTEAFFKRFETKPNSTGMSAGLGLTIDLGWMRLGAVSTQFASATSDEGEVEFSGNDLVDNLGFGVAFMTPTYNKESQLNLLKATVSMEVMYPWKHDEATLAFGGNLRFQLLPEVSVDLMAGYKIAYDQDSLFDSDWDEGLATGGLSVRISRWLLDLHTQTTWDVLTGGSGDWLTTAALGYAF